MRLRSAMRTAVRLAVFTCAGCVGLTGVAFAEPPPERELDLGIGAYGCVPAVDLEVEGRHRITGDEFTRHFGKDLGDAFGDWDGGGGGYVDFRYRRFVALVDGAWVQSDFNSDGYNTSTIVDAKIGFRVLDVERPWSTTTGLDAPRLHLDLLAGARFHNSEIDVDDSSGHVLDYDQHRDWLDPVVGLRWGVELIPNLSLGTVADIGGFDIGNASHLTWSVTPRLTYTAWDHFDLFVGWRHLSDDHDSEREVDLSGPQAGLGYRF